MEDLHEKNILTNKG